MLSFVFAVYALPCTFVSDWLHERELCGANSPLWAHALCGNAQLLDEHCFRPDDHIAFICLPWKGEYLPICTEEDKARSFSRVRDIAMRAVCGASMSRNECYAKYWGATAQAWADCNILGVCGKVGEAATHATISGAKETVTQATTSGVNAVYNGMMETINAAASSAREAAKQAALAAGKSQLRDRRAGMLLSRQRRRRRRHLASR